MKVIFVFFVYEISVLYYCFLSLYFAVNEIAAVTDNSIGIWTWDCGGAIEHSLCRVHLNGNSTVNGANKDAMQNIEYKELVQLTDVYHTCAALSQNGQYIIVAASDFSIRLWDVDKHTMVKQYQGHTG